MLDKEYLSKKYNLFYQLMLAFLIDSEEDRMKTDANMTYKQFFKICDEETILGYLEEFNQEDLEITIIQGKEILTLNSIPIWWVKELVNDRYPFPDRDTDQDYCEWLKWIIETLEEKYKSKYLT